MAKSAINHAPFGNATETMADAIRLERFCFPVTLKCNLKCKLCVERAPYYDKPYHPSLGDLVEQVEAMFAMVEHIGLFDITGGEPFLRRDLPDLIRYLFNNHRQHIGKLRIVSNGTLMPPDGFIEAAGLWQSDFHASIDNYFVSAASGAVGAALAAAGVPFELRDYSGDPHCGGWVDYGDLRRKHSEEDARKLFAKCMIPKLGFFTCMVGGYVFPCTRARLLFESGIVNVSMGAFDNSLTKKGKKERLRALLNDAVVEACRYCNGLCDDSRRFVPAEQLSAKEASELSPKWKNQERALFIYTQTYNNEKTIARTIESVLNQTRGDFIYLIVNNGSTDGTGEIIQEYAKRDPRIVYGVCERNDILGVLLLPNRLIRKTLNNNIFVFRECYRCTVDGDDSVQPDFAESILRLITEHEPDMIVSGYRRIDASTGDVLNVRAPETDLLLTGAQKVENFQTVRALLLCQWGKVYKIKFLQKGVYFHVSYSRMGEIAKWHHEKDTLGVLSAFYCADTVGIIGKPLYDFHVFPQSAVKFYYSKRYLADALMFHAYLQFLEKYGAVSEFNLDFCCVIYLSLIEHTLQVVIDTSAIGRERKLRDILDILLLDETKTMLTRAANPTVSGLARRGCFISRIRDFVDRQEGAAGEFADLSRRIEGELDHYTDLVEKKEWEEPS